LVAESKMPMRGKSLQVTVITGASRGIGAAIARAAGQQGHAVAVNFNKSRDAADKVVKDIIAGGGKAIAVAADVTKEQDVAAMFAEVDAKLGRVTGLVNNAGGGKVVLGPDGMQITDATAAAILGVFNLNVTSTILCTREAARRMSTKRGGQGGAIVNITSDCGRRGGPVARKDGAKGIVIYGAAKAAVDGFTLGAAAELGGEGIRINSLRPATVMTEAHDVDGPQHYANMSKLIPLGRPGQPREIADVALFLLSEQSSFMTGAFVDVTGGR
jgi:NAD(P)-dependent dehydrogenase (short-subunit alcohol dehydrogenase family)